MSRLKGSRLSEEHKAKIGIGVKRRLRESRISEIHEKYILTEAALLNLRGISEMILSEKLIQEAMDFNLPAMGSSCLSVSV